MNKKLRYGLLTLLAFMGLTVSAQTTFDFDNNYATLFPSLGLSGNDSSEGDINEDVTSTAIDGFTITVSKGDDPEKNPNRLWNNTPRLRIYSGTITISGSGIETIQFIHNGSLDLVLVDKTNGDFTGNIWTGNANEVVFACGSTSTQLNKIIINGEITPIVPVEVSIAQFLEEEDSEDVWYQLTGTVKNITDPSKGYFDLEDAEGRNSVYVYGLASERGGGLGKFSELNIAKGDILTLIGNRYTHINSKGEIKNEVTNAFFVSVEKSTVTPKTEADLDHGTADDPISVAAGIEAAEVVGSSNSANNFYVAGVISRIEEEYGAQYGNATFYITDKGSDKEMKVFRAKYFDNQKWVEGNEQIAVDDKVVLCGKVVNYQGKSPQITSGYLVSLNYTAPADPETYEVNVADALTVAAALSENDKSFDFYQVTGYVVEEPSYGTKDDGSLYGNVELKIADTKGGTNTLTIFRAKSLENELFTEETLDLFYEGDLVTFYGKLQNYVKTDKETGEKEEPKFELVEGYLVKASASLDVPASGRASFCSAYPIVIENQNVYIVSQVSTDKALLQKVESGIIESGTGLLVEGSGTVNFAYAYGERGTAPEGNLLKGALKDTELTNGQAYILNGGKFYLCTAGTSPGRKAYLPANLVPAGAKIITISDETTGINEMNAQDSTNEIYTIGGIRVKNVQQKGIYIINGKKVVK